MSATLNTEPLVDVDDDELNTNQRKKVNNTRAFGDLSFVCIFMLQYGHIPYSDPRRKSNRESVQPIRASMSMVS